MTIQDLITKWEQRRTEWAKLGVHLDGSQVAEEVLVDLQGCASGSGGVLLTLADASALSGYSVDHLSKLLRAGTIPNSGRKGAPRVRRKDLPLRPTSIASGGSLAYDAAADARRLQVRR